MKSQSAIWALALFGLCALCSPIAARRLALRPLSPEELRRALLEVGGDKRDIGPNGRSVASAISGIKGFALGIIKGIGGALLFDVVTSNETTAYVSYLLDQLNSQGNAGNVDNGGTAQEVCFRGRSALGEVMQARHNADYADSLDDDSAEDDDANVEYDNDDEDYVSSADQQPLGRQAIDVDTAAGVLTCIVVNRGRTLFRQRRSPVHAPVHSFSAKPLKSLQ